MDDLTPRQTEILKKIIVEYTETGHPVGSDILDKKYNLGVSPATVRNEMVELAKKKYLKKSHFSSGRVPTAAAFRFYIQNLMQEKDLSTADEVSYKSDVWDSREELHRLLQQATRVLAKHTKLLAVATTTKGDIYYCGINNVLNQDEFLDIDVTRRFFLMLDEEAFFSSVMREFETLESELLYLLGEKDLASPSLEECATVFGMFEGNQVRGAIGVMGPKRMQYDMVVPNVKYFSNLLQTIMRDQGF